MRRGPAGDLKERQRVGGKLARRGALAVLLAVVGGPAAAAEWGVEQLMQVLAAVKSSQAAFVELKHIAILTTPLQSRGRLVYTAPDRLEKHTRTPQRESLLLERDQLTIEGPGRKSRTVVLADYPVARAFVESIRSTLAGDLATLTRFYEVKLDGEERRWRLLLKPRDPQMQELVSEIRMSGSRNWIEVVEIVETNGDRSVMTIARETP
jgi:outer membrane lipoprotein-sorting protein